MKLEDISHITDADCVILAVAHSQYKELKWEDIDRLYRKDLDDKEKVLIDVKGLRSRQEAVEKHYMYWRL